MNTTTTPTSGRPWRLAAALFAVLLAVSTFQARPGSAKPPQQAQATALGLQSPRYFGTLNGVIYLSGINGVYGNELWRTDGTAEGTQLFKDLDPTIVCPPGSPPECDPSDGMPRGGWMIGGRLLFAGRGGLWATDGTATGTVTVTAGLDSPTMTTMGDALYFPGPSAQASESRALWRTDGTVSGTVELGRFPAIRALNTDGNRLLILADGEAGLELWASDGTAPGTAKLGDAGIDGGNELVIADRRSYWQATHPTLGHALWASDGTAQGTGVVMDLNPASTGIRLHPMIAYGGRLYFAGSDDGQDLWRTDGTLTGTLKLAELSPTGGSSGSIADSMEIHGGRIFFTYSDSAGAALWTSGGTSATTRQLIPPSSRPQFGLQSWGGQSYFLHAPTQPSSPAGLWATDGTPDGTRQHVVAGGNISASSLDRGPDAMIMAISYGSARIDVYATRGTTATTRLLQSHSGQPTGLQFAQYLPGRLIYGTRLGLWSLPYTSTLTRSVWLPRLDLPAAR